MTCLQMKWNFWYKWLKQAKEFMLQGSVSIVWDYQCALICQLLFARNGIIVLEIRVLWLWTIITSFLSVTDYRVMLSCEDSVCMLWGGNTAILFDCWEPHMWWAVCIDACFYMARDWRKCLTQKNWENKTCAVCVEEKAKGDRRTSTLRKELRLFPQLCSWDWNWIWGRSPLTLSRGLMTETSTGYHHQTVFPERQSHRWPLKTWTGSLGDDRTTFQREARQMGTRSRAEVTQPEGCSRQSTAHRRGFLRGLAYCWKPVRCGEGLILLHSCRQLDEAGGRHAHPPSAAVPLPTSDLCARALLQKEQHPWTSRSHLCIPLGQGLPDS